MSDKDRKNKPKYKSIKDTTYRIKLDLDGKDWQCEYALSKSGQSWVSTYEGNADMDKLCRFFSMYNGIFAPIMAKKKKYAESYVLQLVPK